VKPHSLRRKKSALRLSAQYPYVRIRRQYYPLIPLTLQFNGKSVNTFGLVDSGASISLFRPEIAKTLGITLKGRWGHNLRMAKGSLYAFICEITVKVAGVSFPTFIGFSRSKSASFNIIGRKDFFNRFGVYFDESKRRVGLVMKK